jgi:MoxR-like ATPase
MGEQRFQHVIGTIHKVREQIGRVIVGKEDTIDLLLSALVAGGHVLLEDVPGTGKTLLAKALAQSLDCRFRRIQFTPDLLPSDVSGIHFFNQKTGEFEFRPGPVFTNVLLADEINRATPRTQSSLLECMEERQVTIDGVTHRLGQPFLVIATQNPVDNQGTFPLPEAQLDRFLLRVAMGYPTFEEGLQILKRFQTSNPLESLEPAAAAEAVVEAQQSASAVAVSEDLLDYLLRIVEATRSHPDIALGVSPRGSQALLKAAQAFALVQGRSFVTPDDIKRLAVPVLAHRIVPQHASRLQAGRAEELIRQVLGRIEVPAEPAQAR